MLATNVTFPAGGVAGTSTVSAVHSHADGAVVVVAETPFHPVDHTWPDQPGDAGAIRSGDDSVAVVEAVMAAVSDEGSFAVGAEIPVKRGEPGWTWLVGHRLTVAEAPGWLALGATIALDVDAARRDALSRGHTACHLASLALDLAVADLWRKDPGTDALGAPDFEGRANQSSRIAADGSVDQYRLGKSLRKAGFDTQGLVESLVEREAAVNAQLSAWIASGAQSAVETDGPAVTDRRRWRCGLPEGDAVIPCGGTHVQSLGAFASITVSLGMSDPQTLVMTTTAVSAG